MTVQELIDKLQTMPPDAKVVCSFMSECIDMDDTDIELRKGQYIERNKHYITYSEKCWDKLEGKPNLIDVCYFRGN